MGVRFLLGGSEDTWICEDGKWVKHGAPSAEMPTEPCPLSEEQEAVKKYVEENIVEISPVEAVLGGTWYVTDIEFLADNIVDVTYEDGHIMSRFMARYSVGADGDVVLDDIALDSNFSRPTSPDDELDGGQANESNISNEEVEPVCEDLCGDGVCQEIVCMAIGCPCAESKDSCFQDCGK